MSIASNFPSSLPSLLLDFANVKRLDPRITFTRTTTATYYDGVTTAKAEENLVLQSQTFDNASWGKGRLTVTADSVAAPDGTTTAETIDDGTTTGDHSAEQSRSGLVSSTYTVSCYAKEPASNSRRYFGISIYTGATAYAAAIFDLQTQAISSGAQGSGYAIVSSSCTSVGNSWYRCVLTVTTGAASPYVNLSTSDVATVPSGNYGIVSYTGSNKQLYIWGAQLEQRASATAYTATTTQAITNYIPVLQTASAGQARFDHNPTTGESLGLLIEEARTNSQTYSSDFINAVWTLYSSSITTNTIVAPDGTLTGDKIIPNSSNTFHLVAGPGISGSGSFTMSVFAKAGGYPRLSIRESNVTGNGALFDLSTGSVISTLNATTTITSVGNGWYRCTATITWGTSYAIGFAVAQSTDTSLLPEFSGNGFDGVFLWGAQVEAGSFATSYIPTVASSVTRNADAASMTGTNFSSWFNNGEGTLFVNFKTSVATGFPQAAFISDGSSNNSIGIDAQSGLRSVVTTLGVGVASFSASKSGSGDLVTLAYKVNDFGSSFNGAAAGTDTSGNLPVVSQFGIGQSYSSSNLLNGTIKKISYYPIKATSTQLQSLTV